MAYEEVISALADPTRRHIFEALRGRSRSVGELAAEQPVSRPAVSQHLRVLEAARLVQAERQGNRRVYAVRREGLEELRRYLDEFWSDALWAFGEAVTRRMKRKEEERDV